MTTYDIDAKGRVVIDKDPDATLDYSMKWTDWLADITDTMASHSVTTSDPAVTVSATSAAGGIVTAWLAGGTPGTLVAVTFRITTANVPARTDDRTIYVKIKER